MSAELQQVLDLAAAYSRVASPAMHARDEACRRMEAELRKALRGAGIDLDVSVSGRQSSYSPLAWAWVFSRRYAPTPTSEM